MRSVLAHLLLLCLTPLLLSAAPGAAPPAYNDPIFPTTITKTTNSSSPYCTDLTTGVTYPSCWDRLGMNQFMLKWNYTAQACEHGEIWSTCFLRLAYGSAGYDCSRLSSLNCTAPRLGGPVTDPQVFYGAYNIYAINTYLSTWETALYALTSQPAISQLTLTLSAPGLPRLTPSSLLTAILTAYGLDRAADEALIDILPTGPKAPLLDTSVTYYSTQLATLLAGLLQDVMSDKSKLGFVFLARGGQMMAYPAGSLPRLEARLATSLVDNTTMSGNGP